MAITSSIRTEIDMLFLKLVERKALDQVKRHPRNFAQYQQVNALLELAKGEPLRVVARKVGISEDRLIRWARNFELNRVRLHHHSKKRRGRIAVPPDFDRKKAASTIDRKARSMMPPLERLLLMAKRPPTAIGANLDDDPADLF